MQKFGARRQRLIALSAACLSIPSAAHLAWADQNGTWASAVSGNWSDTTKWVGGLVASGKTGQTADFTQTNNTSALTVNLDANYNVGSLLFNASSAGPVGSWTLSSTNSSVLTLYRASSTKAEIVNESASASVSATIGVTLAGTLGTATTTGLYLYAGTGSTTPSNLFFTGTNTFTGEVILEQGIVGISNANALGSSSNTIYFDEGTGASGNGLEFTASGITLANPITLNRKTPIDVDGNDAEISGVIGSNSGAASGSFSVNGGVYSNVDNTSHGSLLLDNPSNSYTASWNIASDTTLIAGNSATALGSSTTASVTVSSGGTLALKNTSGSPIAYTAENLAINNNGAALNGAPVGGLENLAGANTFAGAISLNGTSSSNPNGISVTAGSLTLSGTISGGSTNPFQKLGTGPLYLTGTNSFTGTGTISAGSLFVNTPNFAAPLSVASGATLGGNGNIAATVTVKTGGTLSPGNSANATDSLTVSGLTLSSAATYSPTLNSPASGNYSATIITGTAAVNLASANLVLNSAVYDSSGAKIGDTFIILSDTGAGGTFSNEFSNLKSYSDGLVKYSINYNVTGSDNADDVILQVTAVPEPASLTAGMIGLGWIGLRRRNRHSIPSHANGRRNRPAL